MESARAVPSSLVRVGVMCAGRLGHIGGATGYAGGVLGVAWRMGSCDILTDAAVLLRMAHPAADERRHVQRPIAQQGFRRDLHSGQQISIA